MVCKRLAVPDLRKCRITISEKAKLYRTRLLKTTGKTSKCVYQAVSSNHQTVRFIFGAYAQSSIAVRNSTRVHHLQQEARNSPMKYCDVGTTLEKRVFSTQPMRRAFVFCWILWKMPQNSLVVISN